MYYVTTAHDLLDCRFCDQLQTIGQVFFLADFVDCGICSTLWISKTVLYGQAANNSFVWRFWDQLQPIGQVFFRADLFWHIFDLLDFKSVFFNGKTIKNTFLLRFWDLGLGTNWLFMAPGTPGEPRGNPGETRGTPEGGRGVPRVPFRHPYERLAHPIGHSGAMIHDTVGIRVVHHGVSQATL